MIDIKVNKGYSQQYNLIKKEDHKNVYLFKFWIAIEGWIIFISNINEETTEDEILD